MLRSVAGVQLVYIYFKRRCTKKIQELVSSLHQVEYQVDY